MTLDEFRASLDGAEPSEFWGTALQALWWDAKGNWAKAHGLVQRDESDPESAWVHAYLHRKEGDLSNSMFWYGRAGQPVANEPLGEEWRTIVSVFLERR
jgi:hypothetical protein